MPDFFCQNGMTGVLDNVRHDQTRSNSFSLNTSEACALSDVVGLSYLRYHRFIGANASPLSALWGSPRT